MIHRSNLALIVEDWYDIALRMKSDEKANKAFGWILEMVRCCPQRSGTPPYHAINMNPHVDVQFAYAIASSQAPGGPLAYTLRGKPTLFQATSSYMHPMYIAL